jgi:hypothetical protein
MMRILAFYGFFFALFGIYLAQYLNQYREAYKLWVQEIVYDKDYKLKYEDLISSKQKSELTDKEKDLFSRIESLSRDLCTLADKLFILFSLVCFTFFVTISLSIHNLFELLETIRPYDELNTLIDYWNAYCTVLTSNNPNNPNIYELNTLITVIILSTTLFISLPIILSYSHINILKPNNTFRIDEKLFYVWYKHRCFRYKQLCFKTKLRPRRLYKIFAQKYMEKQKNNVEPEKFPRLWKNLKLNLYNIFITICSKIINNIFSFLEKYKLCKYKIVNYMCLYLKKIVSKNNNEKCNEDKIILNHIEIPDDIKEAMEEEGLLPKNCSKP